MAVIIRKNTYMYDQLNKCASMKDVDQKTVRQIWDKGSVKSYEKGETIMRAKEDYHNIAFLLSGKVIQYNLSHLGKRKILFVFGKGAMLNDHIFDRHAPSVYCEAIETCEVFIISKDNLARIMEKDFTLVQGLVCEQEKKMWRLCHQLKNTIGNIYMERKLAAKLWKLARDFGIEKKDGVEIDINISVTFLADMLGTPRETASRLVKILVNGGLIRHEKKRILIPDTERLAHFYKTGEKYGENLLRQKINP